MSDLALTVGTALVLLGLVCFVCALAGWVKPEVVWFPPDPDPVDEHHATLPDLTPWLPPRDEPWLFAGWYEQLDLEPSKVDQMIADIEAFLKEHTRDGS